MVLKLIWILKWQLGVAPARSLGVLRMAPWEWFKALYEENCLRVLNLLKAQPFLVGQGLKEDHHGRVFGGSIWKGRTALHVGVRRGSVDLVKVVLGMFDDGNTEFELGDLLAAKDGWHKLDALAMAVVNGNRAIIQILAIASLECQTNPYEISSGWEIPAESPSPASARLQLRQITEVVMANLEISRSADATLVKDIYKGNRDFNFLPWEEYLFHFTFLMGPQQRTLALDETRHNVARSTRQRTLDEVRQNIFDRTRSSPDLRRFLCELQDGQGRTALHVAVDEGTVLRFLVLIHNDSSNFLSVADGTGKLALHRAAALENPESLRLLLEDGRIDRGALYCPWEYSEWLWRTFGIDMELVVKSYGGKGHCIFDNYDFTNVLHISIIHKRRDCVRLLLDEKYSVGSYRLNLNYKFTRIFFLRNGERRKLELEPLQLAAVVGDASTLDMLLKKKSICDPGRPSNWPSASSCNLSNPWPALHLAAASGKFESLKVFMDSKNYDMMVKDLDHNTTLHHATKGREFHFSPDLMDLINCQHAIQSIKDDQGSQARGQREDVERRGCIELLLQVGFDIWKTNKANQAPYMGPDASAELLAWWYDKLAKETIAQQSTLNAACNAISVTATLVATASFQGLLQPPLGWNNTTQQMTVSSLPVRIFVVCDTFSFYFAVAAIMSALIPSLPMAQESMMDELRKTRMMVTIAVGFLFPSIVSILIAFAAASIAVIPNTPGSWNDGGLSITTASLGGLICLGVMCLFSVRLLRLTRTLFNATTF